jgi:hypothetical protein
LLFSNSKHWLGQAFNLVRFWWVVLPVLILLWIVRKRDWPVILLAALPPLAVVLSSVFRLYPYGEVRLMSFTFPALYLLVAESLAFASRRAPVLLFVLAPYVFNGAARDVYNMSYMRVHDLRALFATISNGHRPGEPIYADPSYAAPLQYHAPETGADLHAVVVTAPSGPGWYLQQAPAFEGRGASLVVRSGNTIVVHVPAR